MPVTAVQGDDERQHGGAVPRLGDVEREAAPRVALVLGVEDADPGAILAQRRRPQPGDQRLVVTPGRLEEPAAHRVEGRRQRVERFLHAPEAAQGTEELGDVAGAAGGIDERCRHLERAPGDVEQAVPQEVEVVRPVDPLAPGQRLSQRLGLRRQPVGQPRGERRMQMTLHPHHALERLEQRRYQRGNRVGHGQRSRHRGPGC